MRVLYFHQHFTTPAGASGTRSYEFARRLVAAGHQVTMVCGSYGVGKTGLDGPMRRGRREGDVDGIHVIEFALPYSNRDSFWKRSLTFARFAMASTWLALSRKADIVFATTTPLTAGIPGIVAKALRRRPFVFEVRDLWPELPRAMGSITNPIVLLALEWLEWISYRTADRCVALAPGIVEGIARRGVPRERIDLIPNGCDLELFHPRKKDRAGLHGIRDDEFVALFSGAHGLANGLDAILDAAAVLRDRGRQDIRFLFVGDGMCKPGLLARAEKEGLTNCTFWGPLAKTELTAVTASVDAGLQTLRDVPAFQRGTSPNKFFDYIASGIPVLNNYPGWLADMITQWSAGVVVPPGSASRFADAMEGLADNRRAAAVLGSNARGLAEAEFSRDQLAVRFITLLEQTAAAR